MSRTNGANSKSPNSPSDLSAYRLTFFGFDWLIRVASFAYMLYLWIEFGESLAFAKTQANWRMRPAVPLGEKLLDLVTLEPVWSIFDPASPCYWARSPVELGPFFSLHLANPIYWLAAIVLVVVGAAKRWLTAYEVSLSAGLLLIPYVLRGHEMCMAGMGRFAAVVFPVYLVLGRLLAKLPWPVSVAFLALCAFFLGAYSALFAAWYRFY